MDKIDIAIAIVACEFIFIFLIIIATFIANLTIFIRTKRQQKLRMIIESYFSEIIGDKESLITIEPQWRRLDMLLGVIKKVDNENQSPAWLGIRAKLLHSIMLPLARKAAISKNWAQQFYAAQTFQLKSEEQDKLLIANLINSEWQVVRLAAVHAAIRYGTEEAFDNLIQQLQKQPRLTQSLYLQVFTNAQLSTRPYITKFLKRPSDPYIRLTCYRILLNYPPAPIDWDINEDLDSKNINIKIAALKFLSYVQKEAAIPVLIKQLDDQHWESKVIILHSLGHLKAEKAIPKITDSLNDDNWWVSLTAALALKNIGEKGEKVLSSDNISKDVKAYEVARHVLNTFK